eukprot:TRINITY_DN325_c1_g1_i1.p1 TRINITY_DN325_c1_g1~~TRINITY_DN325_c1_g1_i1.p1  ORF type:complete len:442 (+),score=64.34 TRINITY_DN325_c1_g1_i1:50-1375(+)
MAYKAIAVTVPGKVLVSGGYLIVDRPNIGISLAVSARFHCVGVAEAKTETDNETLQVMVDSPQFKKKWRYLLRDTPDGVVIQGDVDQNKFVEAALLLSIAYTWKQRANTTHLHLHLQADDEFYGNAGPGKGKTGLGSSAGLVSSVVACVFKHFSGDVSLSTIHAIAQIAHCKAQGKIGSGFDVASAMYGSVRYIRYTPTPVQKYITDLHPTGPVRFEALDSVISGFDHDIVPLSFPDNLCLVLGDISKGSETPGMVANVFKWKNCNVENSNVMWKTSADANEAVYTELRNMFVESQENPERYHAALDNLKTKVSTEWGEEGVFCKLRDAMIRSRLALREIGRASDTEIEPAQQTDLLEATLRSPGVLAAACPGAGGYDAIFAVCLGSSSRDLLTKTWNEYTSPTQGTVRALEIGIDQGNGLKAQVFTSKDAVLNAYPSYDV